MGPLLKSSKVPDKGEIFAFLEIIIEGIIFVKSAFAPSVRVIVAVFESIKVESTCPGTVNFSISLSELFKSFLQVKLSVTIKIETIDNVFFPIVLIFFVLISVFYSIIIFSVNRTSFEAAPTIMVNSPASVTQSCVLTSQNEKDFLSSTIEILECSPGFRTNF